MADCKITNAAAIAACNAIVDLLDGGSGAGLLRIYTGTAPSNADDSPTGTLLAELTLSDPAFGDAADANPGATATAASITADSSANATGTAGYFRAVTSAGTTVLQGTVTTTGNGGDLTLNSTSITSGNIVSVTSWTYTVPEG